MQATLTTRDGITLATEHHTLARPRARVVFVHGYAEHRGRYREVVDQLLAANFECHLFDLRGHGESGGKPGHVDRFAEYVDDLRLVIDDVRAHAEFGAPLIVFAHSLGGLIAMTYVSEATDPPHALAVSSPFLKPGFEIPLYKRLFATVASKVVPSVAVGNTLDPSWISTDTSVVDAYKTDPLVQRSTTPRWFTEVEGAQQSLIAHASDIRLPFLMLLGGDDQIADHQLAAAVFEKIGSGDKTLKTYAGYRHEVLNEVGRAQVTEDLVDWLATRSR